MRDKAEASVLLNGAVNYGLITRQMGGLVLKQVCGIFRLFLCQFGSRAVIRIEERV